MPRSTFHPFPAFVLATAEVMLVAACGHSAGGPSAATPSTDAGAGGRGRASDASSGGAGGGGGNQGAHAGGERAFRVVGRTDGNARAPRFQWSGVHVTARFRGTGVAVDLDGGESNFFEVILDGEVVRTLETRRGRELVSLASNLPLGEHEVVLWRRTEGNNGSASQVFGVQVEGGALLASPPPRRRLEVIGDSITCGYGNEGVGPTCGFTYTTENHYQSYAAVAARELDAELFTECWSGKGVLRDYWGETRDNMPALYPRALATDGAARWDFSWQPEAIVVNLGTNDFGTGDPGTPYVSAYEQFLSELRLRAPHAEMFLVIGPMLAEPSLSAARAYLDEIVRRRRASGDTRVMQLRIAPQNAADGYGCDYHPSVATHIKMGRDVARMIRERLGW